MGIQRLNQGTPTSASQIPFYDPTNGVDRRCSVGDLKTAMFGDADSANDANWITQYEAPSATGYGLTVKPGFDGQSVWMLVQAVANYAAGTITFPALATLADRQEIEILSSKNLTALTLVGSGASILGAPTALTAYVSFKMRFDLVTKTWYPAI